MRKAIILWIARVLRVNVQGRVICDSYFFYSGETQMDAGKITKFDGVWYACGNETILDIRNNIIDKKEKQYGAKAVLVSLNRVSR